MDNMTLDIYGEEYLNHVKAINRCLDKNDITILIYNN